MARLTGVLLAGLTLTLGVFGLSPTARSPSALGARREAALAAAQETARLTALSVRAALAQVEQAVVDRKPAPGIELDRLAEPPGTRRASRRSPYAGRPRAELARLPRSTRATPNGLPEAVVARIALGDTPVSLGTEPPPDVVSASSRGAFPFVPPTCASSRRLGARSRSRASPARGAPAASAAGGAPVLPAFLRNAGGATASRAGRGRTTAPPLRRAARQPLDSAPASRARLVADAAGGASKPTCPTSRACRCASRPTRRTASAASACGSRCGPPSPASAFGLFVVRPRPAPRGAGHRAREGVPRQRHPRAAHAARRDPPLRRDARRGPRRPARVRRARRAGERAARGARRARAGRHARGRGAALRAGRARRAHALRGRADPAARRAARGDARPAALADAAARGDLGRGGRPPRAAEPARQRHQARPRAAATSTVAARAEAGVVRLSVSRRRPRHRAPRPQAHLRPLRARRDTDAPGTGLGLHLAEQVAHAHGGRVDLVSEEGRGCTFTLVPARSSRRPPRRQRRAARERPGAARRGRAGARARARRPLPRRGLRRAPRRPRRPGRGRRPRLPAAPRGARHPAAGPLRPRRAARAPRGRAIASRS